MVVVRRVVRAREEKDPFEVTVESCRRWLKYVPAASRTLPMDSFGRLSLDGYVPAVRFDRIGTPGPPGLGQYLPALRDAQFFWAAATLDPMRRDAALNRRTIRDTYRIVALLRRTHRAEWRAWERAHPVRSLSCLLDECALDMAVKLGSDPI